MLDITLQLIREHLAKPGVTKAGLAEAAGLHANTLRGVDAPEWNPTATTLRALERVIAGTTASSNSTLLAEASSQDAA
jgi:3,4-dihydroxy 2-butanone 4-phosphate synthase/GTP cyclohydrolase II